MLNSLVASGRLVRDPEERRTKSNTTVATFTLAVDGYKKNDGSQSVIFLKCVATGKVGESVVKYTHKGDLIEIQGYLYDNTWVDTKETTHHDINVGINAVFFIETKKTDQPTTQPTTDETPVSQQKLPF